MFNNLLVNLRLNEQFRYQTFYKVYDKNAFSDEQLVVLRVFQNVDLGSFLLKKSNYSNSDSVENPLFKEINNEIFVSYDLLPLLMNTLVCRFFEHHNLIDSYFDNKDAAKPKKFRVVSNNYKSKSEEEIAEINEIFRVINSESFVVNMLTEKKTDEPKNKKEEIDNSTHTIPVFCYKFYDTDVLNSLFEKLSKL